MTAKSKNHLNHTSIIPQEKVSLYIKREWDRNRKIVRIRFRRPTSAQLSRAVKADEISVVELTQPLCLARQSKDNREARTFVPASLTFYNRFPTLIRLIAR